MTQTRYSPASTPTGKPVINRQGLLQVDPDPFLDVHGIIPGHGGGPIWKGHWILAIDGSAMNLLGLGQRRICTAGQKGPLFQGLVSRLHRTGDDMPMTFPLSSHGCERIIVTMHDHGQCPIPSKLPSKPPVVWGK